MPEIKISDLKPGLYLREVGPVPITECFPTVPQCYNICGPYTQVVGARPGPQPGTIILLVVMDPAEEQTFEAHNRIYEKEIAAFPVKKAAWEAKPQGSAPTEPVKPVYGKAQVAVMRVADLTPLEFYGTLTPLAVIEGLYFFSPKAGNPLGVLNPLWS